MLTFHRAALIPLTQEQAALNCNKTLKFFTRTNTHNVIQTKGFQTFDQAAHVTDLRFHKFLFKTVVTVTFLVAFKR